MLKLFPKKTNSILIASIFKFKQAAYKIIFNSNKNIFFF